MSTMLRVALCAATLSVFACSSEIKDAGGDPPLQWDDTGNDDTDDTDDTDIGDRDGDGDGVRAADGDCNDSDATVYPGAPEVCDGVDNDCNEVIDDVPEADLPVWYLDFDGDGYGGTSHTLAACDVPDGYVSNPDDCDDAVASVYPGAEELCDSMDNDCDGSVDEGATTLGTWYEDWDNDGYGDPNYSQESCEQPSGYVPNDDDCNDVNDDIHPGATEFCNSIDDDCDGTVDESPVTGGSTWYEDWDSDGYGDPNVSVEACSQPSGYVANSDDCNDVNASITTATTWYEDWDSDGYGDPNVSVDACSQPSGYVANADDCNDVNASITTGCFSTPETVSDWVSNYGERSAVGVDSMGQVHVVYFDAVWEGIRYNVRDVSGSWDGASDLVWHYGNAAGIHLDAVMDGLDRFQVAYTYDEDGSGDQELWFTYVESDGSFAGEDELIGSSGIDSTGHYVSIDVDTSNMPSIAYFDDDMGIPFLLDCSNLNGGCSFTTLDSNLLGETGHYTTLAVDSANDNHVAFYDPNAWSGFWFSDELQYSCLDSQLNSQVWSEEVVAIEPDSMVLDVKSDNTPCVAYHEPNSSDLLYSCRTGGSWTTPVTVDSTGDVGISPAMAFNSSDEPVIAYYDLSNGDLKIARESNGSWTVSTVDSVGNVGQNPSIAIDAWDTVYVTYYDVTNQTLKLVEG